MNVAFGRIDPRTLPIILKPLDGMGGMSIFRVRAAARRTLTSRSPDRRLAHLAAGWSSTGAREDGTPFPRPGRCTVTLRRADPASPWLGTHTHFSLNRGTPAVSHRSTSGPEASS